MKIKYVFADESLEIEVAEEWGNVVIELNRLDNNVDHKETRRHTSLESFTYEDKRFFDDGTDLLVDLMSSETVSRAMSHLTERQQYLIQKICLEGWKYTEIATLEGVDESAIRHAVNRAKSKLKKILS